MKLESILRGTIMELAAFTRMLAVVVFVGAVLTSDLVLAVACMVAYTVMTKALSWSLDAPTSRDMIRLADAIERYWDREPAKSSETALPRGTEQDHSNGQ